MEKHYDLDSRVQTGSESVNPSAQPLILCDKADSEPFGDSILADSGTEQLEQRTEDPKLVHLHGISTEYEELMTLESLSLEELMIKCNSLKQLLAAGTLKERLMRKDIKKAEKRLKPLENKKKVKEDLENKKKEKEDLEKKKKEKEGGKKKQKQPPSSTKVEDISDKADSEPFGDSILADSGTEQLEQRTEDPKYQQKVEKVIDNTDSPQQLVSGVASQANEELHILQRLTSDYEDVLIRLNNFGQWSVEKDNRNEGLENLREVIRGFQRGFGNGNQIAELIEAQGRVQQLILQAEKELKTVEKKKKEHEDLEKKEKMQKKHGKKQKK